MKKSLKSKLAIGLFVVLQCGILTACGSPDAVNSTQSDAGSNAKAADTATVRIGIAWRADTDSEFYTNVVTAIKEAGGEPVLLDQVVDNDLEYEDGKIAAKGVAANEYLDSEYSELVKKNTYKNSNAEAVVADVDAVIFTGGEDISPMLCKVPVEWHGIEEEKDYNATRDVSDYLLMAYCIDKDIPTMGFCRGMQMMAVVSGGIMIQDIPTYFEENGIEYNFEHRNVKATPDSYRDYAPHDVSIIDKNSCIYDIFGTETVKAVPSWHHQAVESVDGTNLCVTAVLNTNGIDIIEGLERTDKQFIVGYQFHPEAAIVKHVNGAENANQFMTKDEALKSFTYLIDLIEEIRIKKAA